jgi:hypothetical protein
VMVKLSNTGMEMGKGSKKTGKKSRSYKKQ